MVLDVLIQAAGSGTRLGRGPKAFVSLGGKTLLERAIAQFDGIASRIVVAVRQDDIERARRLVDRADVACIVGGDSRSDTTRKLIDCATAPLIVLHDVVHPLLSRELLMRVVTAAQAHGAAAPGLLSTEFLFDRAGNVLHRPGEVLAGQKPVAFGREAIMAGYAAAAESLFEHDPSLLEVLELGGTHTVFVEGDVRNVKITTPGDLDLATALLALAPPQPGA